MNEKISFDLTLEEAEVLLWALEGCEDMIPGRYASSALDIVERLDQIIVEGMIDLNNPADIF